MRYFLYVIMFCYLKLIIFLKYLLYWSIKFKNIAGIDSFVQVLPESIPFSWFFCSCPDMFSGKIYFYGTYAGSIQAHFSRAFAMRAKFIR